jgi:hypothetical protein
MRSQSQDMAEEIAYWLSTSYAREYETYLVRWAVVDPEELKQYLHEEVNS